MMRNDLKTIAHAVPHNARVLDLGCGDGELLAHLRETRGVSGMGVEIDTDSILACIEHGVPVVQNDLDTGLADFRDKSFDLVIMSQSFQQMKAPHRTLQEMLRIGHEAIITFPNFGHWNTRRYLFFLGRMPMSRTLPHRWFDTPNIHLCTCRDFEQLCVDHSVRIRQRTVVDSQHQSQRLISLLPNLFGEIAIYHVDKPGSTADS